MIIAIIVIAAALVIIAAAGYLLSNFVLCGRRQTLEEARAWQENRYDFSFYDKL